MFWKRVLSVSFVISALSTGIQASPSDGISANVPLSSPLYGYIEKFDGWDI